MKRFVLPAVMLVLWGFGSTARAQYGLYGSPELLRLTPATGEPAPATNSEPATIRSAPVGMQQATATTELPEPGVPMRVADAKPLSTPPSRLSEPRLAPTPEPSSMTDRMLEEAGVFGPEGACGSGRADACLEACPPCGSVCDSLWYASASAVIFTRDQGNRLWTSFEEGNNANQIMNTNDAKLSWEPGYEIKFGRRFCCGIWAVEADFWRIDGFNGEHSQLPVTPGGHVSTPLIVDELNFGSGTGQAFFDGADEHRLRRRNEMDNIEINFIRNRLADGWGDGLDLSASFGFRYFRFYENLRFGTLRQGGSWSDLLTQAYLEDEIRNNVFALQIGLDARYHIGYNLRVFATPKIGLGLNHMENNFDAYRGDGLRAVPTAPGVVGTYPVTGKGDGVTMIGQVDVGMDWQFHPQWKVFWGYRLLAMTGMGLADHQIPTYVVDIPELQTVRNNGNLLIHGGFAGVQFDF